MDVSETGFFDELRERFDGVEVEIRGFGREIAVPVEQGDGESFEEAVGGDGDEQLTVGF